MTDFGNPVVQRAMLLVFGFFVAFIVGVVLFLRWLSKRPKDKVWKCTNCGRKFRSEQEGLKHFVDEEHDQGRIEEFVPHQKHDVLGNKI